MLSKFFQCMMIAGFITCASCAHAPAVKKTGKTASSSAAQVTGYVLDPQILAQGGDLALVPFKAGAKTEANDETDRMSMMILKGIKDSLDEQNGPLHVIDDASQGHPKIALQGYINEFSKPGRFSRMMMHPYEGILSLEGEVWFVSTGQRLLSFSVQKKFNPKKEKPINAAYALGHSIGDYIGAHAK